MGLHPLPPFPPDSAVLKHYTKIIPFRGIMHNFSSNVHPGLQKQKTAPLKGEVSAAQKWTKLER